MRLVIDCCVRGEASGTRRLTRRCLDALGGGETRILELEREGLVPLGAEELAQRDRLALLGEFDHEMFRYARQFRDAEEIVVAAPYWDLSFPALLKVYLERVSVAGLTFGYQGDRPVGYCRARRLIYLSTCGGYTGGRHLGEEYVRALAEMLGVTGFQGFAVEGLDVDPARREEVLEAGIRRVVDQLRRS